MSILVGLLLVPVGAVVGTGLFFLGLSVFSGGSITNNEWAGVLFIGGIVGSAFAAPVGVIVLPLAHTILRRKNALSVGGLTAIAAAFGFVSVLIVMTLFWGPGNLFADMASAGLTLAIAADGALTGAICGLLFGRIMRWFEPAPAARDRPAS